MFDSPPIRFRSQILDLVEIYSKMITELESNKLLTICDWKHCYHVTLERDDKGVSVDMSNEPISNSHMSTAMPFDSNH